LVKRLSGLRRLHRERGAVAVEFALVLPLLLLLVLGGIDWGYYFFAGEIAANAAREGARAGAIQRGADPCGEFTGFPMQHGAINVAQNYMMAGGLITSLGDDRLKDFDTTCPSPTGKGCCALISGSPSFTDQVVVVTVRYEVRPGTMSLTGFLPSWLLPAAVVSTSTMRREP
jgi:Flp pilus assembly protein TadG